MDEPRQPDSILETLHEALFVVVNSQEMALASKLCKVIDWAERIQNNRRGDDDPPSIC